MIIKRNVHPIFIEALFIIAKLWKLPRCPSTGEWMKKMWYIHTIMNYSAIKRMKCYFRENEWNHHAKQNKPDSERQIPSVLSHMKNLDLKQRT
jgi:hypothetical protein